MVPQFPRWTADFSWLSSKIQSCLHLVLELDKYFGRFEMNLGKHLLVGCSSCSLPRFSNTCFLKNRWCSWFSQVKFLFVGQKAKHGIKVKNLLWKWSLLKSDMQHHPLSWLFNVLKFRGKYAHLLLSHLMRHTIRRSGWLVGIIDGPRLEGAPGINLTARWVW